VNVVVSADNPEGTMEELNKLGYELKGKLIVQKKN